MTTRPPAPPTQFDAMLCFNLYVASRGMVAAYRPLLDALGLTYPQYLVMLALWDSPHPPTVKALGAQLHLDSGTLSPLLKRLEAAGHLERRRSSGDERELEVTLTARGEALRGLAAQVPDQIRARVGLSTRESRELVGLLRRLTEHLGAQD